MRCTMRFRLARTLSAEQAVVINLSGRGDKDMHTVAQALGRVVVADQQV